MTNGEVTFLDDLTMKVVAPQAHVDYGLANIIGIDSVEVNAEATVQVRTPILPISSVLPMWLPATCVYGPLAGDVAAALRLPLARSTHCRRGPIVAVRASRT